MINGMFSSKLEPTLEIVAVGVDQVEVKIVTTIDTGFNGALSLPFNLIQDLRWPNGRVADTVLADGGKRQMDVYRGIVLWNGTPRIVDVFSAETKPLLGLMLLEGHLMTMDIRRGGDIVIQESSPKPTMAVQHTEKPLLGLVGGIGSGKSLVAAAFARQGGFVIEGDVLGHEALGQPEILQRIAQRWGDRVLNPEGKVDRRKMGTIVFASPVERTNLEMVVFPWIERRIREEIARGRTDPKAKFIVLDAAIMLEAGWNQPGSKIVYIHAPRAARLERLQGRRGWTAEDLSNRESAQWPLSIKASRADTAIDNSGSPEETQRQVDDLVKRWGWQ